VILDGSADLIGSRIGLHRSREEPRLHGLHGSRQADQAIAQSVPRAHQVGEQPSPLGEAIPQAARGAGASHWALEPQVHIKELLLQPLAGLCRFGCDTQQGQLQALGVESVPPVVAHRLDG